jgi:hypothetical protein
MTCPEVPMSDVDYDALVTNVRHTLRLYTLPANVARYHREEDTHDDVAERCAPTIVDALLAAGLCVIPPGQDRP